MSSSLSRSRSVRQPAGGERGHKNEADSSLDNDSNTRSVSPSRLPLKGPSSTASTTSRLTRAGSTAVNKSGDSGASETRSRPVSGVFGLGRSGSLRRPGAQNNTTTSLASAGSAGASRPPVTTRNGPLARPISFSGPSPTSSRPTTSSGLPSSTSKVPPPRSHTRTKSSATALTSSTILRPPSQTLTTSSFAPSQPSSCPPPPTSRAALHTRQPSASAAPPRRQQSTTAAPTAPAAGATHRLGKPAFTTLQQHYSPARNLAPKPLTSTFLAPPSPSKLPANVALGAETARLQAELLQLHMLHRAADGVSAAWHDSARRALGDRFARAAREEEAVRRAEARAWEDVNAAALLRRWGDGGRGGRGPGRLEEKVTALDGVLGTVWALGEKGGRYNRVVRRFETWAERIRDVVAARAELGAASGREVVFVTDLETPWKEDCEALFRKLLECKDTVRLLGEVEGGQSSLARMLDGLGALVEDMLAELDLMLAIEREAVKGENEWVRAANSEEDGRQEDTPRAGAIWRAF